MHEFVCILFRSLDRFTFLQNLHEKFILAHLNSRLLYDDGAARCSQCHALVQGCIRFLGVCWLAWFSRWLGWLGSRRFSSLLAMFVGVIGFGQRACSGAVQVNFWGLWGPRHEPRWSICGLGCRREHTHGLAMFSLAREEESGWSVLTGG